MAHMEHGEPKLIFPGLAGFYAAVSDLWYPMIRVTVGAVLFVHGWTKINTGVAGVTAYFAKNGFVPASGFAYAAIFIETVGAICIVIGLFTRVFAAAVAVQMAVITFAVMMPRGFIQMETTVIWGIVMLAIALRGGGPYSLDRVIGTQI
jgi:putative oxidoreductase